MRLAITFFPIKSFTGRKSGRFFLALFCGIFFLLVSPAHCQAGFASSTPFSGASWELVGEYPVLGSSGTVQSVCATEDYIICIENYNDQTTEPDVVSAYYKNDTDADGNPVTQYALARQVQDADYAHANGMAYNPVTHEILVAGYSSPDDANYGCVFRMDPDTLEQKERVKLSDSYNILGIGYLPSTGGYLIQTDADGDYGFKVLDASLAVVDDWGPYPFSMYAENFQDLCTSGDLFFLFPLTMHLGIGNHIQTYSLSQKALLADETVDFGFSGDITENEPEGLCETNPGEFLAIVDVKKSDSQKILQFYRTRVPYLFSISTSSAEHGSVSGGGEVSRGESATVSYTADSGYRLAKLSVDGLYLPVTEYPDSYTFSDVQKDHTLFVTFEPVPTATPTATPTVTPTVTPATVPAGEPTGSDFSSAGSSFLVSLTAVKSHLLGFGKNAVQLVSTAGKKAVSFFAVRLHTIRTRLLLLNPFVLLLPFITAGLFLLFWLRLRYVRRIRQERARKSLERRRKLYQELMEEDTGDDALSLDELLQEIENDSKKGNEEIPRKR